MLNLMVLLLVPVHDPPATQVVGAELYDHPVVRQDADVVHPHFPADMSENLVPVVQLHPEEGIRERLDNRAFNLNGAVFLGHVLRASLYGVARAVARAGLALWCWPYYCAGLIGPALPGSRRADSREMTRKDILRSVSWSRTRTPERRPGRAQQMGRKEVYSTPRPGANRPGYTTLPGASLFPVAP